MAAIIKPIEAKSVHQIQSGQVIVDLCSVVKELVENGLDAEATAIEVRFKNNGLDAIEVQDNGNGISAANYDSVALKHYTSKLSTYDDLSSLQTFGFRGEALSSLCAVSTFSITTAQAHEAPKGNRLDFETSGKLRFTSVVAAQKGTTAVVENLFEPLPVRRKELAKNVKREYGKVLGLLHAYACISVDLKLTVKNAMPKAKSMTVFSTKGNSSIRENIANVYGAKTLSQLIELDLNLEPQPTPTPMNHEHADLPKVQVRGHISRPVFGEGRQTPDRQMFFVNGRPCGLPQIAKAINEVYKSFNVSQSPFICADFRMDTNSYDVNVSPDKRTIFLHNASALTESLKIKLAELFDNTEQTVPHSHVQVPKLPTFRQLSIKRNDSVSDMTDERSSMSTDPLADSLSNSHENDLDNESVRDDTGTRSPRNAMRTFFQNVTSTRRDIITEEKIKNNQRIQQARERRSSKFIEVLTNPPAQAEDLEDSDHIYEHDDGSGEDEDGTDKVVGGAHVHVRDFNARMAEQQARTPTRQPVSNKYSQAHDEVAGRFPTYQASSQNQTGVVQDALSKMRSRRPPAELATITIGDRTVTRLVGTQVARKPQLLDQGLHSATKDGENCIKNVPTNHFSQDLRRFGAPGTQHLDDANESDSEESTDANDTELKTTDLPEEMDNSTDSEEESDHNSSSVSAADEATQFTALASRLEGLDEVQHDEEQKKRDEEEFRVAELIRSAEESAVTAKKGQKRTTVGLKRGQTKDLTVSLLTTVDLSLGVLCRLAKNIGIDANMKDLPSSLNQAGNQVLDNDEQSDEQQLSLTVSKSDFLNMTIAGQFNLGFILAVRPKIADTDFPLSTNRQDELFIIDQHASDEKYNFERLQAETTVSNQRLVQSIILELTAVEEEIVMENKWALEKNGFIVHMDTSGEASVGQRCQLMSLPLSKEVVFNTRDLDELIHLLAETPTLSDTSYIPRPSKVRKMFAMRACRSSIMIGKSLSHRQMSTVLQHLGSIDKPWNCPHGRPTMRHLISLDNLDSQLWEEGNGLSFDEPIARPTDDSQIWRNYIR